MEVVYLIDFTCFSHVILFNTGNFEFISPVVEEMRKSKPVIYAIFIIVSDLEDRGSRVFLKVGKCLPVCTVSQSRRQ